MRKKKLLPVLSRYRNNLNRNRGRFQTYPYYESRTIPYGASHNGEVPSGTNYELRGSILIVTILIISILVIFVVGLSAFVANRLKSVKYFRDTNRAHLVAVGAVNKAIVEVNKGAKSSWYDNLSEPWSNNSEAFSEIVIGRGSASVSYEFSQPDGEPITFYGCADEERRININKANRTVLERLFIKVAELTEEPAAQLTSAIIDWRDPGDEPQPNGAEDSYYQSLAPSYHCKNADFEIAEELLLVKGMTPEIYARIKDTITVYGRGRVNINTATESSLIALGLPHSLADKIYRFRAGSDGIPGTEDDNIITREEELVAKLRQFELLSQEDIDLLNNLIVGDLITKESEYYRIKARGTVNERTRHILCIIRRDGPIVFWRE